MGLQENTLFDNRFLLKRFIGRGGFAEVWLAEDQITHLEEALKVYVPGSGMDEDGLQMFVQELTVVHDLRHTNLLTPKMMGQFAHQPYLILPYCPSGSLTKRIGKASESEVWAILHQVASGLAYLHDKNIVHQDIKPDNILIDANGDYVITDFGISQKVRSTLRKSMREQTNAGTTDYMAPERYMTTRSRKENDIWSLGAMLYELLEGVVPFNTPIGSMAQMNGIPIPEMEASVSDKLKTVIYSMLDLQPENRPSAAALAGKYSPIENENPENMISEQGLESETTQMGEKNRASRATQRMEHAPHKETVVIDLEAIKAAQELKQKALDDEARNRGISAVLNLVYSHAVKKEQEAARKAAAEEKRRQEEEAKRRAEEERLRRQEAAEKRRIAEVEEIRKRAAAYTEARAKQEQEQNNKQQRKQFFKMVLGLVISAVSFLIGLNNPSDETERYVFIGFALVFAIYSVANFIKKTNN